MVEITGLKEQSVRTEFYPERGRRGLDGGQLTDFGGIGAKTNERGRLNWRPQYANAT